jgi:hypothetical protein
VGFHTIRRTLIPVLRSDTRRTRKDQLAFAEARQQALETFNREEYPRYILNRWFQFCAAVAVLLVFASGPTLNCMSLFYEMNMQEMDCCKTMASCDMGATHSSCCESSSDPYAANGAMASKTIQLSAPAVLFHLPVTLAAPLIAGNELPAQADTGSPPPTPPGSIPILRI